MSDRRILAAFAAASLAALVASGCQRSAASPPAASSAAPASAPAAAPSAMAGMAGMPHGDHNPHHGGIVMMKGELHYEVVLDPTGHAHQLFFTDATREDLPASVASTAALTIHRPDGTDEAIPLQIDESGESWTGSGRPIADAPGTMVRVAFTINNEPYWIDLPFKK
ncbi:MAG TPA: hypothetical protein VG222_10905 [Vicinamibacterales bacterium]|nr:hypothetical protein [Vicinamibacterales bacterium]